MDVRQLLVYLDEGYEWIVDIDLKRFFDNVPQDRFMSLVHAIVNDGDTESLIRKYLKAGVMTPQGCEETKPGTPKDVFAKEQSDFSRGLGCPQPAIQNIFLDILKHCWPELSERSDNPFYYFIQ